MLYLVEAHPTIENGNTIDAGEGPGHVVAQIVERFHPQRIVLFGSQARGDAGPESDIDLFIEMESNLRPIDRVVEVLRLFGLRSWGLDVFVYTPDEVARQRGHIGNLLSYVDAEGRVVYERPN